MRRWTCLALPAIACEPSPDGDPRGATVAEVDCAGADPAEVVGMNDITFQPAEVRIEVGEVVEFVNLEAVLHDVASGSPDSPDAGALFRSPDMLRGDRYCLAFDREGSFDFWCTYHPQVMQGVVDVRPAGDG